EVPGVTVTGEATWVVTETGKPARDPGTHAVSSIEASSITLAAMVFNLAACRPVGIKAVGRTCSSGESLTAERMWYCWVFIMVSLYLFRFEHLSYKFACVVF